MCKQLFGGVMHCGQAIVREHPLHHMQQHTALSLIGWAVSVLALTNGAIQAGGP